MVAYEEGDMQQLLERRQILQEQLETTQAQLAWHQRRWKAKNRKAVADANPHWNYSEDDCEMREEWLGRVSFSPNGSHFLDPYGRAFVRQNGGWRPLPPQLTESSAVAITDQGRIICKSSDGGFRLGDDASGMSFTNFHITGDRMAVSSGKLIVVSNLQSGTKQQFLWHTSVQAIMFSHDTDYLIVKYEWGILGCLHLASSNMMERIYGPLEGDQICLAARRLRAGSESNLEAWWLLLYSPGEQTVTAFVHSKGKISSQVVINNVIMAAVSQSRLFLVESLGNLVSRALPNLREDSQLIVTLTEIPTQLIVPGDAPRYVALQFQDCKWKFILLS